MDKITKLPWQVGWGKGISGPSAVALGNDVMNDRSKFNKTTMITACEGYDFHEAIARTYKLEDAEYICRAVNSHEGLVEAAKALNDYVREYSGSEMSEQFELLTNRLEEALKAADGEEVK